MWTDPIIEEIHAVRQKLMDEAGGDLHEVIRRVHEHRDPARRIIVGQPRRPQAWVATHVDNRSNSSPPLKF